MAKAHKRGGLYRNAGGHGFHDGDGDAIPLQDVPRELLSAKELQELDGEETAQEGDGEAEAGQESGLPKDFPGREQLIAAGLNTPAAVFAHPNIATVKGIGPRTAKAIAELKA
ncbi:MAG TPA: hypothetical protein VLH75_07310 [Longimicrobiales bacterium]|nr:hypothetical protein [Longimicrobiales bacterium]